MVLSSHLPLPQEKGGGELFLTAVVSFCEVMCKAEVVYTAQRAMRPRDSELPMMLWSLKGYSTLQGENHLQTRSHKGFLPAAGNALPEATSSQMILSWLLPSTHRLPQNPGIWPLCSVTEEFRPQWLAQGSEKDEARSSPQAGGGG